MEEDERGGWLVEREGADTVEEWRSPSLLGARRLQVRVWVRMWMWWLLASTGLVPKSAMAGVHCKASRKAEVVVDDMVKTRPGRRKRGGKECKRNVRRS